MCEGKEMATLAGGLHPKKVGVASQAPKDSRTKGLSSEIVVMETFPLVCDGNKVMGSLFFIHHDYFLKSLNEELDQGGFRPATVSELTAFLETYCGSCETLSWSSIIATHPDSIEFLKKLLKKEYGEEGVTLIPVIRLSGDRPVRGIIEYKGERDCDVYFDGHADMLVLAIKK